MLPNVVHRFESLNELFALKPSSGHWRGRIHAIAMRVKSGKVRDDYMSSMYEAVTINLSHIASMIILKLYQQGLRQINCGRFHKMLYLSIKQLQETESELHRSLLNPEEYGAIVSTGSSRLEQFLRTASNMKLVHVEQGEYVLDQKLVEDFAVDEIRTENLISVYANEVSPLSHVTRSIDKAMKRAEKIDSRAFADYRFNDQILAYEWDRQQFQRDRYDEINSQQTQTADANWFFLKSTRATASAVLLVHGFLSGPAEMKSLGERLHAAGHHVLAVRLKGHGTSPWDLRNRNWHDWAGSVARGYDILRAYSKSIHIVGFSTGGLLALNHAASNPGRKIRSVTSVNAPVHFKNRNMIFVPLVHHANRLVSWVSSEGLMPFTPNEPENPDINYQHVPVRALYQLQQLIDHFAADKVKIDADVHIYQGDRDPVVDPASAQTLDKLIIAENRTLTILDSDIHGVIYRNIDQVQQKICASIL
jgi:esterase/lipase